MFYRRKQKKNTIGEDFYKRQMTTTLMGASSSVRTTSNDSKGGKVDRVLASCSHNVEKTTTTTITKTATMPSTKGGGKGGTNVVTKHDNANKQSKSSSVTTPSKKGGRYGATTITTTTTVTTKRRDIASPGSASSSKQQNKRSIADFFGCVPSKVISNNGASHDVTITDAVSRDRDSTNGSHRSVSNRPEKTFMSPTISSSNVKVEVSTNPPCLGLQRVDDSTNTFITLKINMFLGRTGRDCRKKKRKFQPLEINGETFADLDIVGSDMKNVSRKLLQVHHINDVQVTLEILNSALKGLVDVHRGVLPGRDKHHLTGGTGQTENAVLIDLTDEGSSGTTVLEEEEGSSGKIVLKEGDELRIGIADRYHIFRVVAPPTTDGEEVRHQHQQHQEQDQNRQRRNQAGHQTKTTKAVESSMTTATATTTTTTTADESVVSKAVTVKIENQNRNHRNPKSSQSTHSQPTDSTKIVASSAGSDELTLLMPGSADNVPDGSKMNGKREHDSVDGEVGQIEIKSKDSKQDTPLLINNELLSTDDASLRSAPKFQFWNSDWSVRSSTGIVCPVPSSPLTGDCGNDHDDRQTPVLAPRDLHVSLAQLYWKTLNSSMPDVGGLFLSGVMVDASRRLPSLRTCSELVTLLTWGPHTNSMAAMTTLTPTTQSGGTSGPPRSAHSRSKSKGNGFFWDGPRMSFASDYWKRLLRDSPTIMLPRLVEATGPDWWKTVLDLQLQTEIDSEVGIATRTPTTLNVTIEEARAAVDALRVQSCRCEALIALLEASLQHRRELVEQSRKTSASGMKEGMGGNGAIGDNNDDDDESDDDDDFYCIMESNASSLGLLKEIWKYGRKPTMRVLAQTIAHLWVTQRHYLGWPTDGIRQTVVDGDDDKRRRKVNYNNDDDRGKGGDDNAVRTDEAIHLLINSGLFLERTSVVHRLADHMTKLLSILQTVLADGEDIPETNGQTLRRRRRGRSHGLDDGETLTEKDVHDILWNAMDMQLRDRMSSIMTQNGTSCGTAPPRGRKGKKGDSFTTTEHNCKRQFLAHWICHLRDAGGNSSFASRMASHVDVLEEYESMGGVVMM